MKGKPRVNGSIYWKGEGFHGKKHNRKKKGKKK